MRDFVEYDTGECECEVGDERQTNGIRHYLVP